MAKESQNAWELEIQNMCTHYIIDKLDYGKELATKAQKQSNTSNSCHIDILKIPTGTGN